LPSSSIITAIIWSISLFMLIIAYPSTCIASGGTIPVIEVGPILLTSLERTEGSSCSSSTVSLESHI
jgi:hypothetical protein